MKSITEKSVWQLTFLLLAVGYLLHLGTQPLYLEEPRRAFITMELLANDNWIVPTLWGLPYYNKPPFFNWILISSTSFFGTMNEWTLRLPTVLFTWMLAGLLYGILRRPYGQKTAMYGSLFWLCSSGILFYFSMLAEIDLFFSLVVFSGIYAIYFFYQRGQLWWLFSSVYALTAIAFLSKGIPSVVFTGLSLLTFFIWKKQFWKLSHPAHFAGFSLFLLLVGGYYYAYARYTDPLPFLQNLWSESSDRAAWSNAAWSFISHLLLFPLDLLKEWIPALFVLPFLFRKDIGQQIRRHDLLFFSLLMLLVNLLPYWLSPGTRMRYIYMLLPFGIILLTVLWQKNHETATAWQQRTSDILCGIPVFVLPLGVLALPFIPDLAFLDYLIPLTLISFVLLAGVAYTFVKKPNLRLGLLLLSLAMARIIFDLTVLPQRADSSGAHRNQVLAQEVYEIVGDAPLAIINDEKIFSYTATYYLNQLREVPLIATYYPSYAPGCFYMSCADQLPENVIVHKTWEYEGSMIALVEIKRLK
jgi:4-amino-4-deoxy-L-arabinose transferase-like glycosyltransferase